MSGPAQCYVAAAVEGELAALAGTGQGGRAHAAFKAAAALGGLVATRALPYDDARDALLGAALSTGLPEREARHHVERGLRAGMATPRELPANRGIGSLRSPPAPPCALPLESGLTGPPRRSVQHARSGAVHLPGHGRAEPSGCGAAVLAARDTPRGAGSRVTPRPSAGWPPDVGTLWARCEPVTEDAEVSGWLRSRGLDPGAIEMWNLARALPRRAFCPTWTRSRAGTWAVSGHRLLVPLYDVCGVLVSLRARDVTRRAERKSLAPAGFGTLGAVHACPLARQVLVSGTAPESWSPRVVTVTEGEADFLALASAQREGSEQGQAVLAVSSGAWTPELADRVPDGLVVVLATDADDAGERYAEAIARTLRGRGVELRRWRAGGAT